MLQSRRIVDRESEYSKRRLNRIISPDRNDAFQVGPAGQALLAVAWPVHLATSCCSHRAFCALLAAEPPPLPSFD